LSTNSPQPDRDRLIAAAVALAIAALFLPQILLVATGRVMPQTDMRGFHVPLRYLYQQALRDGDSILWTPWIYGGAYVHGEGQIGFFHPVHLAAYYLLPLATAVSLEMLSGYALALIGCYLLFRRLPRVGAPAAWTGAFLFAFGGFNLMHAAHMNMIAGLAHLPLALLCIERAFAGRGRGRILAGAGLAAVIGSQWLLGFPQAIYLTLIVCGGLVAVRSALRFDAPAIATVAAAVLLGTAIGAVQILPTLEMARHAVRPAADARFALTFSLHPMNLVQLVSPYTWPSRVYTVDEPPVPHEFAAYDGAFVLIAALWLATRYRQLEPARRRLVLLLGAAVIVAFVLAFGRFGYVQNLLVRIPGLALFRAPARFVVLAQFALAALGSLAIDDWLRLRPQDRGPAWKVWPLLVPAAATLACVVIVSGSARYRSVDGLLPRSDAAWALAWTVPACLLAIAAARGRRFALALLILLAAADLGHWGYSFTEPGQTLEEMTRVAIVPPVPPDGARLSRPDEMVEGNLPVMLGWKLSEGYLALAPSQLFDRGAPSAWRLAGAEWRWDRTTWSRVANPMPPARMMSRASAVGRVRIDIDRVDIDRVALVPDDIGPLAGAPGTARLMRERPGRLSIETESRGRQLLVTTTSFHPGWRASAGCEGEPVAVYGGLLGCVVPEGRHQVEFVFRPRSFVLGAWISGLALVGSCGVAALWSFGVVASRS